MPPRPHLFLITGPTAVGKTDLSLRWAETHNAEIVSCDSLLFYRGMDIGTAKPTREELARVPHHLIDVCEPADQMDVVRFVEKARVAVDDIARRGRRVLVTGGSGFYLKAFLGPVFDGIEIPDTLRAEVEAKLAAGGVEALIAELRSLNPSGLGTLDLANPRRVSRALERCRASGLTLEELTRNFENLPGPFADWEPRLVRLDRDAVSLNPRIDARVKAMLDAGLVSEVQRLRAQGFEKNTSAARAIGYREVLDVLDGRLPAAELASEISRNTRALVKKQRTWFRTQLPEHREVPADKASHETLFDHLTAM